jgi:Halocarboxylic acid dehydrogenase DehI
MVSAADHRGSAAHPASEVLEEDATGNIKGIYSDIRSALRSPFVPDVFLALATEPDYFQIAWRQLHTNIQTVYFERCADELRARAVKAAAGLIQTPTAPPAEATGVVRTFHYVVPKVLLAVTALRVATTGQRPKLVDLPGEDKRQVASGVPEDMATPTLVSLQGAEPPIAAVFDDIRATLGVRSVHSEFRAIATWPEYFENAWRDFKSIQEHAEYRRLRRDLTRMADEVVLAFPFRLDLSPHTLRHCGLTESSLDAVRSTLDRFQLLLPLLTLGTASLAAGAFGAEAASATPFPVRVQ